MTPQAVSDSHSRPLGPGGASSRRTLSKRVLFLQNPGRVSRFWIQGLINAAQSLHLDHVVCELGPLLQVHQTLGDQLARPLAALLERERIGAVVSYTCNGINDLPMIRTRSGTIVSIFEMLGIPHLMFWWDHPHWAHDRVALAPELQSALRAAGCHHFLKSDAAAAELRDLLGWPQCHTLLPSADPALVGAPVERSREFDVVTVVGQPPQVDPRLDPFLDDDDPDTTRIHPILAPEALRSVEQIWEPLLPATIRETALEVAAAWVERKAAGPHIPSWWHLEELLRSQPAVSRWLAENPLAYFDAARGLNLLNGWRRSFIIRHLARRFRLALFGADWSSVGVQGDPAWIEHDRLAATFGRGQIGLSIAQGHDEEGVILKPFEIIASGTPVVADRTVAMERAFAIGTEFEGFQTPGECRDAVARLLADPARASAMAERASARLTTEHTWSHRLADAFGYAGLAQEDFRGDASGRLSVSLNLGVQWSPATA